MTNTNQDRAIGRLEGRVDSLDKKLDEIKSILERENASAGESRRRLYERVGHLETSIEITGQIEAQMRDEVRSIESKISNEVMPTIHEVRRWKITGMTVLSMVGIAGASIGAFIYWAWDVIVSKWNAGP